jgi:hypothetical protein
MALMETLLGMQQMNLMMEMLVFSSAQTVLYVCTRASVLY